MHRFNGYDIELTRGDSLQFRIHLSGRDLPEGSVGLFTVKASPRDEQALIQKRVDAGGEELLITLTPKETNLTPRAYFWDVRILIPGENGGYEVETPMEYAAFVVLEAVGRDFGVPDDPGMDGDLPVLTVLIREAREAIRDLKQSAGGLFAPAIRVTADGSAVSGAAECPAYAVVNTLDPQSENGVFIPHENVTLSVNGNDCSVRLPEGVYAGSFDWVSGELLSTGTVIEASKCTVMEMGTNSTGLPYVRLRIPEYEQTTDFFCAGYTRNDDPPYADKSIRVMSSIFIIYDSDLDLNAPEQLLSQVQCLLIRTPAQTHQLNGRVIPLKEGGNILSSDAGSVQTTYVIDTKTYIDTKFAALSAALLGG